MTLPASGAISFSNINTELGFTSTAQISLNDANVRTLFGVASGAIDMNTGHGKSNTSLPGVPTGVSASATSSSTASVSFSAPACTGHLSIDLYRVKSSPGCFTATGASSPITVSGLSASTSYTFQVQAHNSLGYGCYSSSSSSITTPTIYTQSIGNNNNNIVRFNNQSIVEVESLVVRSNITVLNTGLDTYTNLPTDIVRIDSTGKINNNYLKNDIVRTSNGTINPAILPIQTGPRSMLMRTTDSVGIGIRNAAQKLHVNNGNQCITNGKLSIGTTTPLAAFHILDENSGGPTVLIQNNGSLDTLQIYNSDTPIFYINASCNIGVKTLTPTYDFDVNGTTHTTYLNTSLISTDVINSFTGTNIQINTALYITSYDPTLYTSSSESWGISSWATCNNIGLRVDNNIMTQAVLSISDKRVKKDIVQSSAIDDLKTVLDIPVYRYKFIDKFKLA